MAMIEGLRPGADPTLTVTCRHMSPEVEAIARDWFAGRITDFQITGERSVYIPRPADGHRLVKIKGSGLNGGGLRLGERLKRGPVAPAFDFDGRRMEDVALSHDGAYVGGASMQQAVTEWRVTRLVQEAGHRAVPCLGYGSVSDGRHMSWFSIFGWDDRWIDTARPPKGTLEVYRWLAMRSGEITLDLARRHGLAGFSWLIRDGEGGVLMKDLHPFRRLDPVNMSQVSWVMQVYYALHITAINTRLLCLNQFGDATPDEAPMWMLWPFCPEATLDDWDRLRFSVVAKYIIEEQPDFSPETLLALLESNPITARLMELCPQDFARSR